jgi:hypothetical protein
LGKNLLSMIHILMNINVVEMFCECVCL